MDGYNSIFFEIINSCLSAVYDLTGVRLSRMMFVALWSTMYIYTYMNSHLFPFLQDIIYTAPDRVIFVSALFLVYIFSKRDTVDDGTILSIVLGFALGNIKPLRSNIIVATISSILSLLFI